MTVAEIRAFQARDWHMLERSKTDIWIRQKEFMTPSALLEMASELSRYTRAQKPDWPNTAEREEDLETHCRLAGMLRAANFRTR